MTSAFAEVIGDPIGHSKSPLIHRFWLAKLGMDADYHATLVTRSGLADFLTTRRKDPAWRGCNVTMPLKLDAVIAADEASDHAVAAGAANILVAADGKLVAGNTDVGAVLHLLAPLVEKQPGGGITVLGNGGAARAILVALRMLNAGDVRIKAREVGAAYKLAVEFGVDQEPQSFDRPVDTQGLINATPMGMRGVPSIAIDIRAMPATGWVFDLVTEPAETPLLAAASARGLQTINGLAMLVEQAAESFALLFGADAPRTYDAELMKTLRP